MRSPMALMLAMAYAARGSDVPATKSDDPRGPSSPPNPLKFFGIDHGLPEPTGPLSVSCPKCHAEPDRRCNPRTLGRHLFHKARVDHYASSQPEAP